MAVEEKNLVSNRIIMEATAEIGTAIVIINDGLTALTDKIVVSHDGNREEHITLKYQSSWRDLKGAMNGGSQSTGN